MHQRFQGPAGGPVVVSPLCHKNVLPYRWGFFLCKSNPGCACDLWVVHDECYELILGYSQNTVTPNQNVHVWSSRIINKETYYLVIVYIVISLYQMVPQNVLVCYF